MNPWFYVVIGICVWIVIISIVAVCVTRKDKRAAQNRDWRVKEASLFIVSLLGGALAMLITMRRIRHKTNKRNFMLGLPLIIILHIAVLTGLFLIFWFFGRP